MNCRRVELLLSKEREGLLSPGEAAQVAAHLAGCMDCRQHREEFQRLGDDLRELGERLPPADVERRPVERWAVERWRAERGDRTKARPWAVWPARVPVWTAAAAAAALLVAAIGLLSVQRERSGLEAPLTQIARQSDGLARVRTEPRRHGADDRGSEGLGRVPALTPSPSPNTVRGVPQSQPSQFPLSQHGERGPGGEGPQAGPALLRANRPHGETAGSDQTSALGADDMDYVNGDPGQAARRVAALSADEWERIAAGVRRQVRVKDDFVTIPFPRIAGGSNRQIAAAVESYKKEAAIVDARLAREVTLQVKGTALSDLCEHLRSETGIHLEAGRSVADEKVTLFCTRTPLRDVMRQLSRPFGYTWVRSSRSGECRYELMQDLKSQLLEEELRNRDRHQALIALDEEIQRYQPYLHLLPDEALARSKTAAGEEKKRLEHLAGHAWGPIQLYTRLSAQELAALRAGQELTYSSAPQAGELPLPPGYPQSGWITRGALQPYRHWYLYKTDRGYAFTPNNDKTFPGATPVSAIPEANARITLIIHQSELGRMVLAAAVPWFIIERGGVENNAGSGGNYVSGMSPSVLKPNNRSVNLRLASNAGMRAPVTVQPRPSCAGARAAAPAAHSGVRLAGMAASAAAPEACDKVTTADVLEALHRATGLPIVSDFYTRLYKPEAVSVKDQRLFDTLNQVADTMRLRWSKDGSWLQFRSTSFYDDRLKEVPNRLLDRWVAARRSRGVLTLDDLVEIAGLPSVQLDAEEMAEGIRKCYGLVEWELARLGKLRPHLRFLAGFTPAQRQEALTAAGLPFTKMSLAQQQRYIALAMPPKAPPLQSLDGLAGATLRVDYTQPGWFQWGEVGWGGPTRWVVSMEPGLKGRRVLRPPVRGRTREETLQAVRRVDPEIRQGLVAALRRRDPRLPDDPRVAEEDQIFPTRLDLTFAYVTGTTNARQLHIQGSDASGYPVTHW